MHKHWLSETNQQKKQALATDLLSKLQSVGLWLQSADYVKEYDGRLSDAEVKELDRLERDPLRRPAKLSESKLNLVYSATTANWYTVQYLPVPITCKAPAGARVFLQATDGGEFENGLSIIDKVADDQGNVTTFFVSRGDAASLSQVKIVSPQCSNIIYYNMHVMSPMINFPAYLNDERMGQLKGLSVEQINKMLKQYSELDLSRLRKISDSKIPKKK